MNRIRGQETTTTRVTLEEDGSTGAAAEWVERQCRRRGQAPSVRREPERVTLEFHQGSEVQTVTLELLR